MLEKSSSASVIILNTSDITSHLNFHFFLDTYMKNILHLSNGNNHHSILLNDYKNYNTVNSYLQGVTYINKKNILSTIILSVENFKYDRACIHANSLVILRDDKIFYNKGDIVEISFFL